MKRISSLVLVVVLGLVLETGRAQDLPTEKLKALFPTAASFKPTKKTVAEDKRALIESALGRKLTDAELQQQFYIAMKPADQGAVPLGLAYLGTIEASGAKIELGVGVTYEGGRVAAVKVFAPADSPLAADTFLKQFDGRTISTAKPPAPDQQRLVEFMRAQFDNMNAMDTPQQTALRKIKAAKDPLADEPANIAKGIADYEKLLATKGAPAADTLSKFREGAKDSVAQAEAFAAVAKVTPSDFAKLDAAYKVMNDSCEKCHSQNQTPMSKQRRELVPPRGASEFSVGKEITAPAGQDANAQALASEVKKAVSLIKLLYNLK